MTTLAPRTHLRGLLAAVAAILITAGTAGAQTLTFGADPAGSVPKNFEFGVAGEGGPGRWEVVSDQTAEGGRALAQLSTNPAAYRFLVAIYNPLVLTDGEIKARCKPVSGKTDQACGVIVRAIDARNYYIARSNVLERNVRFYRVRNGQREQLATAENIDIAPGQWHTLALHAQDDRYSVVFNGTRLYVATDTTKGLPRPVSGRVGLWVKADSVTYFDRVEIEASR